MAEIIHPGEHITEVEYYLRFSDSRCQGAGWSFECSPEGELLELTECAKASYQRCLEHPEWAIPDNGGKPVKEERRVYHPPIIRCECGKELELYSAWCSTCVCGRDYNGGGQSLAPRSQWGEETGETLTEMWPQEDDDWGMDQYERSYGED